MFKKGKAKKVTVRFSRRMKSEMQTSLVHSGFGLHGKSKWLKEAIYALLQQSKFVDYIEQGADINQAELTEIEAFYLDDETLDKMKNAFVSIRTKYPLFEGVQSALIRAAVIYKMMLKI